MTRAGDGDSDAAAAFWRDRAVRMRAIAHGGSSGASADDDGDARGNHLGLVALQRAGDAHRRARAATATSMRDVVTTVSGTRATICRRHATPRATTTTARATTTTVVAV